MIDAQYWIKKLEMLPHPEGGYYKETYRSNTLIINKDIFKKEKSASTAIYFLLVENNFSAFHRIKSDELWHFYEGQAVEIYFFDAEIQLNKITLGSEPDKGQVFQALVPAGCWFGSKLKEGKGHALVGCTVAPGFDFEDFEMAKKSDLLSHFPFHKDIINELTRY